MPDKEHMQFTERTVADSPSKSKEDRDASYYNSVIVDVSCSELALLGLAEISVSSWQICPCKQFRFTYDVIKMCPSS